VGKRPSRGRVVAGKDNILSSPGSRQNLALEGREKPTEKASGRGQRQSLGEEESLLFSSRKSSSGRVAQLSFKGKSGAITTVGGDWRKNAQFVG